MYTCVHTYILYICIHVYTYKYRYTYIYPLTEEIRLKIFGSPDMPVFPATLLSDGDSVYSRENPFEIWDTQDNVIDM